MRKLASLLLVCLLITTLTGCASSNQAAQRVCTIRTEARPDAIAVRKAIADRFDAFDAETQARLVRLDVWLFELDSLAEAACSFRTFDLSRALELGIKVAIDVAELKAKGVI